MFKLYFKKLNYQFRITEYEDLQQDLELFLKKQEEIEQSSEKVTNHLLDEKKNDQMKNFFNVENLILFKTKLNNFFQNYFIFGGKLLSDFTKIEHMLDNDIYQQFSKILFKYLRSAHESNLEKMIKAQKELYIFLDISSQVFEQKLQQR